MDESFEAVEGQYMNPCVTCSQLFLTHNKRAFTCDRCRDLARVRRIHAPVVTIPKEPESAP